MEEMFENQLNGIVTCGSPARFLEANEEHKCEHQQYYSVVNRGRPAKAPEEMLLSWLYDSER